MKTNWLYQCNVQVRFVVRSGDQTSTHYPSGHSVPGAAELRRASHPGAWKTQFYSIHDSVGQSKFYSIHDSDGQSQNIMPRVTGLSGLSVPRSHRRQIATCSHTTYSDFYFWLTSPIFIIFDLLEYVHYSILERTTSKSISTNQDSMRLCHQYTAN